MTGTKSQQPETAQDAYRTLLRTRIAPALRAMGFKGSGNSFSMARGDYEVGINFQKNKWSTRDLVTFDVIWLLSTERTTNRSSGRMRSLDGSVKRLKFRPAETSSLA
jgi:Domain of unknown function (DUF4304)